MGNVELGLLDDMQEEVKKMRSEVGEETIKEEQQKRLKPMVEALKEEQSWSVCLNHFQTCVLFCLTSLCSKGETWKMPHLFSYLIS